MAEKTTAVYEFMLTRANEMDKTLPHITDFHYVAFIRNPVAKQASYIDMQAMVPTATLTVIEAEISSNRFPHYELTGHLMKEIDVVNKEGSIENVQKVFYKTFVVIVGINKEKDNISSDRPTGEGSIPVRMLLVDPVAWQMFKNTGFNKTLSPEKANQMLIALETLINTSFNPQFDKSTLTSFMDYVRKKYAGSIETKDIKQIVLGDKNKINLHPYNQITIPPTLPEINVPEYIINTYKPFTTPSFWIFDSFNFGNYDAKSAPENGKIPMWGILINFYNCIEVFKPLDISKELDISTFTHLLGSAAFMDAGGILNRPDAMVNFIGPDMTIKLEKFGNLPKTLKIDNTFETQDSRITSLKIYYPDNIDSAKDRISDCMELFTNHIDRVEFYETTNTTPEWLQFGRRYNLEKNLETDPATNMNMYIHTPICIINIFKRRQTRDATLECINKYAMLRLVNSN